MPAGRPRKPTQQKKAQGTLRKHRTPEGEPQFKELVKLPAAPKTLNIYGKKLWEKVGQELIDTHVLTSPDLYFFEITCMEYGQYMHLKEILNKNLLANIEGEHGGRSALAQQVNSSFAACEKCMTYFGLNPAARSKLGIVRKKEVDPDTEKMKELLGA